MTEHGAKEGRIHVVAEGECLESIAARFGFPDGASLYAHAGNEALRARRSDPALLVPGDEVFVPAKQTKAVEVADSAHHTFRVRTPKVFLRLRLQSPEGKPYAHAPYSLAVAGLLRSGTTDAEGLVEEQVPPDAARAELHVRIGSNATDILELEVRFGALDPLDEEKGPSQRLANLGYVADTEEATPRSAVLAFQQAMELCETGLIDAETLEALRPHAPG